MHNITRRSAIKATAALAVSPWLPSPGAIASNAESLPRARPAAADRHFSSPAVESAIKALQDKVSDPPLRILLENCLPNTLDTTVHPGTFEGKPDTYVVTGDIDAMWLRDSSAQVWPYLAYLRDDPGLKSLVEGVVRRHVRMILIDPYANAFMHNPADPPLSWAINDKTEHHPGVGERKWEIDSLCYTIRLAHGYWKATGDSAPFDAQWRAAAEAILRTFREQQRLEGHGPYSFQRDSAVPYDTVALSGFGNPARPNGMIFSMFRPSDDACVFPLFVPANLFAVKALALLAELAAKAAGDTGLAQRATTLATQIRQSVEQHGKIQHPDRGLLWAYEIDGFGNHLLMDDANAPGLLSMPYLGASGADDPLYQRTRQFVLSSDNPYFFRGKAAEGVGGPHIGLNAVWPMSIMFRALTSTSQGEIRTCLRWLRDTTAGTGFMHESFNKDNPADFTRPWFAWANTLFGELMLKIATAHPAILSEPLS